MIFMVFTKSLQQIYSVYSKSKHLQYLQSLGGFPEFADVGKGARAMRVLNAQRHREPMGQSNNKKSSYQANNTKVILKWRVTTASYQV
jgi:hypothetical protein